MLGIVLRQRRCKTQKRTERTGLVNPLQLVDTHIVFSQHPLTGLDINVDTLPMRLFNLVPRETLFETVEPR